MVMTLRKRVPSSRTTPSPSPMKKKKKPQKSSKSKTRTTILRWCSSSSESESGSDPDLDSDKENNGGNVGGGYESIREQRMKENKERMEKLGIFLLSSKVFDGKKRDRVVKNVVKNVVKKKRGSPIVPRRRSQRSKNNLETEIISISDKWKPEVYTEEDEKLLGDCEAEWKRDVDGVGEDGDLLYDPVNGISCHHCRYKTLRKHTNCNKCRSPQGQLCGDCLYTRYGENVVEAVENPKWTCPACRGICNCSRCRREKGWSPVTIQYPKVVKLGYKSIAHYLILKRHAPNTQKESENVSAEVVDLTEGDAPAPPKNEDPDTSSEWSQSQTDGSDSDNSESEKENNEQPLKMQVDTGEPETCNPDVGTGNAVLVLEETLMQSEDISGHIMERLV